MNSDRKWTWRRKWKLESWNDENGEDDFRMRSRNWWTTGSYTVFNKRKSNFKGTPFQKPKFSCQRHHCWNHPNIFFSQNLVQRRVNEEYLLVNQCIPYYCNTTCHPMTFPLTFEFDNRNKIITDNNQFIKWDWTVLNWSYFIFPYIFSYVIRDIWRPWIEYVQVYVQMYVQSPNFDPNCCPFWKERLI